MSEREVGVSSVDNGNEIMLEVFYCYLGKFSAVVVRYDEPVGSFCGLKNAFKSFDTSFSRRCNCGWKLRATRSL